MAAFRKAAELADMRFYSEILGKALFLAVDTLKLEGSDRLCALSWTVSRWLGFSSSPMTRIRNGGFPIREIRGFPLVAVTSVAAL